MLSPARTKYRKRQKGKIKGVASKGNKLNYGEYGLQALTPGRITSRQIEAARIAMNRAIKRGGKLWITIFPDHPVTKKPAEVRMGKGKGSVEYYVACVKRGRVLYEISGVPKEDAIHALTLAGSKLPVQTRILVKGEDILS